jgi:hypothetical protein
VGRVELGVELRRLLGERVEVGDEVAAHPVHVGELVDLDLLLEHRLLGVDRADVAAPAGRLVRDVQRVEDLVVEAVLADDELVDAREPRP